MADGRCARSCASASWPPTRGRQLTGRATVLTDAILRCSGGALTPGTDLRVVAAVGFVAEPGREQGRDATHPAPAERAALLAARSDPAGSR